MARGYRRVFHLLGDIDHVINRIQRILVENTQVDAPVEDGLQGAIEFRLLQARCGEIGFFQVGIAPDFIDRSFHGTFSRSPPISQIQQGRQHIIK